MKTSKEKLDKQGLTFLRDMVKSMLAAGVSYKQCQKFLETVKLPSMQIITDQQIQKFNPKLPSQSSSSSSKPRQTRVTTRGTYVVPPEHHHHKSKSSASSASSPSIITTKHPLYKTSLCKYHLYDSCNNGQNCTFAHDPSQLRPTKTRTTTRRDFGK